MSTEKLLEEIVKKIDDISEDVKELKDEMSKMKYRINELERGDKLPKKDNLTPAQKKILEDLDEHGIKVFTVYDISDKYNISYAGAYKFVEALVNAGVVKRKEPKPGEGRKIKYAVNKDEDEK